MRRLMVFLCVTACCAWGQKTVDTPQTAAIKRLDTGVEDLTFVYKPIPKEMNGFPLIQQAIKEAVRPSETQTLEKSASKQTESDAFDNVLDWMSGFSPTITASERAFAKALLKKNEKALELLDKALARPRIQCPERKTYGDPIPYLAYMRLFARLKALRSAFLIEQGETKRAFDGYASIMEFGHKLKGADSCLIAYLIGVSVQRVGFNSWYAKLASSTLSGRELTQYAQRLEPLSDDRSQLVNALRTERKLFGSAPAEGFVHAIAQNFGASEGENPMLNLLLLPGLYDSERTEKEADKYIMRLIAKVRADQEPLTDRGFENAVTHLMSFNATGEVIVRWGLSVLQKSSKKSRECCTRIAALRLLLCLKAHQQDHVRLPDSLDELVKKKYLKAIPDDPFGPGTLRYSKARGVIWTVGLDGKNQGGTPAAKRKHRDPSESIFRTFRYDKDPTFEIPFGQPKRAADVNDLFKEK